MTRTGWFLLLLAVVGVAGIASAIEPAYTGPLGNAEEPALRPYKWLWHGTESLFFQTGKSLEKGNMKFPVIGTVEGCRGVRRGVVEFGESAYKGAVFAPVPQEKGAYKELGKANEVIEAEPLLRNASDFACSLYAFPVLIAVDKCPLESDEQVAKRQEKAKETREARKAARPKPDPNKSEVQRAQEKYVPERAKAGGKPKDGVPKNLLKLAK